MALVQCRPLAAPLGAVLAAALALALAPERDVDLTLRVNLKAAILFGVVVVVAVGMLCDAIRLGNGKPPSEPETAKQEPLDEAALAAAAEKARAEAEAEAAALAETKSTEQLMKDLRAWRRGGSVALDEEAENRAEEQQAIAGIYQTMHGASPLILHRFPDSAEDKPAQSATPPFMACGRLWTLKMGRLGSSAPEMRYFCVLPLGHTERLRYTLIFARKPGNGFRERLVIDWPRDLAGHPWGPTLSGEELADYRQTDGSLLVMLHALGLGGSECDDAG